MLCAQRTRHPHTCTDTTRQHTHDATPHTRNARRHTTDIWTESEIANRKSRTHREKRCTNTNAKGGGAGVVWGGVGGVGGGSEIREIHDTDREQGENQATKRKTRSQGWRAVRILRKKSAQRGAPKSDFGRGHWAGHRNAPQKVLGNQGGGPHTATGC